MKQYQKKYTSPQDLVELVKTRGLTTEDETKAEEYIKNIEMSRTWIDDTVNQQRIFYNLSIIKYFTDIISPNNHIKQRLQDLFNEFPIIDKAPMGFPKDWENEPLWK